MTKNKTRKTLSLNKEIFDDAEEIVEDSDSKYRNISHFAEIAIKNLVAHEQELKKTVK